MKAHISDILRKLQVRSRTQAVLEASRLDIGTMLTLVSVEGPNGWDKFSHSGLVPGYSSLNTIVQGPYRTRWISVSLLTNSDGVEDLDQLAHSIVQVALQ